MDVVSSNDDLSDYKVVVAPMLYLLQSGTAENLQKFVKNGGQLLATYFTGYVDKDTLCYLGGFPGDGLAELFGVISEEIDTLYSSDRNSLCFPDGKNGLYMTTQKSYGFRMHRFWLPMELISMKEAPD